MNDAEWAMMRQNLLNIVTNERTLMIGLSAQDNNIRALFLQAKAIMPWNWSSGLPAYVFAEQELGVDQETLLKCVYRNGYDTNKQEIEDQSRIQAYAKPLLTAMVLYCLCGKLLALASLAPAENLQDSDFEALGKGLRYLRNKTAANSEPDRLLYIQTFVSCFARAGMLFREGKLPSSASINYQPIGTTPISQLATFPDLKTSGLPEFAIALGLVGLGNQLNLWDVTYADPSKTDSGALSIQSSTGNIRKVYFAANWEAVCCLYDGRIVSIKGAKLGTVIDPPSGFKEWALAKGALDESSQIEEPGLFNTIRTYLFE